MTPELIEEIRKKQNDLKEMGFTDSDFANILNFIERYKDQKIFRFLRNNPSELLNLDKTLLDQAAREDRIFNLPILGSTKSLEGNNSFELKKNLLEALFTKETLALTKPENQVKKIH